MEKIETYQYKHKDEILPHMREITIIWLEDTDKDLDAIAAFTGCTCEVVSKERMKVFTRPVVATVICVGEATFVYRHTENGVVTPYCYRIDRKWLDENYLLKS